MIIGRPKNEIAERSKLIRKDFDRRSGRTKEVRRDTVKKSKISEMEQKLTCTQEAEYSKANAKIWEGYKGSIAESEIKYEQSSALTAKYLALFRCGGRKARAVAERAEESLIRRILTPDQTPNIEV